MKAQPTEKPAVERKLSLPAEPTFNVRNLGSVRTGKFTQKPLTLFCGPNNTGKTWTMYSLFRSYQWLRGLANETKEKIKISPASQNSTSLCQKHFPTYSTPQRKN